MLSVRPCHQGPLWPLTSEIHSFHPHNGDSTHIYDLLTVGCRHLANFLSCPWFKVWEYFPCSWMVCCPSDCLLFLILDSYCFF